MRYKITRKILILLSLFIGIGALYGSFCMLIDPSGKLLKMDNILPYFKVLPFSNVLFKNYIFSGIALLIVNGVTNITAAFLLIKNKKIGIILGTIFGFTLTLWIIIQFIVLPFNFLSVTYFIFGIIQMIVGYITYVFYMQINFKVDISKYKNIGKNKDTLVVYFSRMGYTKRVAYDKANELKVDILRLETDELTENTKGFWWCGRFGMHKWRMSIKDIDIDIKKYKNVIIVSPIWVFSVASPIRDFCYKYSRDINNVQYIFVHFMNSIFKNVADEVDKILNKKRDGFTSVCMRFGNIKKYEVLK